MDIWFKWTELFFRSAHTVFCLCCVTVHLLVVHGLEDVIFAWAVVVARTCLDEHHLLLHDLAVRALELDGQGCGPVRSAAAAVGTHSTEFGSVSLGGGAARNLELHGLGYSRGTDAFLSFLWKR